MTIHKVEQGSGEWEILRAGKVTASELSNLVTPLGKVKTGAGPKSYLMTKVAETCEGGPLPKGMVWNLDQGNILEEYAKPNFTFVTGLEVKEVGFITGEDDRVGCSPDGLIGDNCGLEIKCPHIETHVRYLLDGTLPDDYILQVQGSLYVTKYPQWKFFSYRRRYPPLILTIEPDEKIQEAIGEALAAFFEQFDAAIAKMKEMNGGVLPTPRRVPMEFSTARAPWGDNEVHDDRA